MKNIRVIDPDTLPKACVIWMHGLGADASDMMGLAHQMPMSIPVRHVCIDAPIRPVTLNNRMSMRAWYDIYGLDSAAREDQDGVLHSDDLIREVINAQLQDGFKSNQIYLAGFSQGGAMALFTGLNSVESLGGIIALSAYLPIASQCKWRLNKTTPIFIAYGLRDPIVLPAWTQLSVKQIQSYEYHHVALHSYNMAHQICMEEVNDLAQWLEKSINNNVYAGE